MRKLTPIEIERKRHTIEELKTIERHPIYVLLDNIRSVYNVGSIFRTSDAALIKKLYLTGYTPHPPRKDIEKTALGAIESVPWEYHKNPVDIIKELKEKNVKIIALEITDDSIPYYEIKPEDFPLCLVIGNEITGISDEVLSMCDLAIEIPQFGIKHSLNVAVAYGIAVYELVKIYRTSHASVK
ncbi:SpoU rRNA Methylase family protein [Candidatus Kryptonium thompsonii]|uniref:SpoU rRNA Methylase family protein n=1 Tax=Candidatus Kryptonium thompsonii TaxID=1633631 RepID=A0A0P1MSL2_9BACT|nr:RNA methyltransferase [Candidatus Kryptonium thompsoni]CUS77404.1 SpoU rRNA Methylase family protein [Candidatus Kryptonium thompsoni]CUS79782.1 SpoU rRNA Methylase family protein [Candidatus Kryptonium thompsoni]CUS80864.1 SpoU rRNA Methylase family protein [Candidatus Kryptonium thompsoni]CUS81047.1 SpoU rRNA Methylase family protein [Candidatus Kryptonium thompsoni]CUS83437.1 SpoU rRNA Methylase family protein [Candidatus Kryptonium thompsoni]